MKPDGDAMGRGLGGLFFAATLLALGGCASIPKGQAAINSVDVHGADQVSSGDVEDSIATQPSPRFLAIFKGVVYDYSIYNRHTLERDMARIERYYRARGFYEVKVRAARVTYIEKDKVKVDIEVQEGPPVRVGAVILRGLESLPESVRQAAQNASRSVRVGLPFEEEPYTKTEDEIRQALTDEGYAYAKVTRQARVDIPNHIAGVWYDVVPGPLATLGPITIDPVAPLDEEPIRRALNLTPGERYSSRDLQEARDAVLGLGVFSDVDVQPQLKDPPPEPAVVPLHVHLSKMKLRAVQLGVGVELDVIRTDLHFQARWEHRNFLGGYRHLTLEVRPGVVLYPTRAPNFAPPEHYLPEEKSRVELRQPGFFEHRTTGVLRSEFNVFPVLLSPSVDPNASVIGYRELRLAPGLERAYRRLYTTLYYNYQYNSPFTYVGPRDPALSGVTISYIDILSQLDLRDDPVHPHKGLFLGLNFQLAGGPFLGNAHDYRVQPEVRGYVPIGRNKKLTFAVRASVGFLFPQNYGQSLRDNASRGQPPPGVSRDAWVRDVQLTYLRALFSGGANSNRGYPLRGVGPHGVIPFFNPNLQAQALASGCDPASPDYSAARCSLPLGGLSLWEASGELRFPIKGPLTGSAFCDMSDVSPQQMHLRFEYLHLSCGPGLRYDTPVGPVRLDAGYRVPGMQILGKSDSAVEGSGNLGSIFGLPVAIALGIGEAF